MATNSQKASNFIEIENQFILRMPNIKNENGILKPHPVTSLLRDLLAEAKTNEETNIDPLKDRLFIEINPETRKGRVKFDNEIFDARLVDLPCIIESLKTVDKKLFYKSADICQMLVCRTKDDPFSDSENDKEKEKNPVEYQIKKYQWPHGLAPSLKNVRRKRFRKCAKKKYIDYAEIEKEVKLLFRADREAVKINYEVSYVEADPDDENDESKVVENKDYDSFEDNMDRDKSMNDEFKPKRMIDESNMSDLNDDTSSMPVRKFKAPDDSSNMHNIEESNDASNLEEVTSNRTNFKNIFVKEVIGDLSSSEEDGDDDEEDEEEEEEEQEMITKPMTSGLFGDDDSISNFEETKMEQRNYEESDAEKTKADEDDEFFKEDASLMSPPQNDEKAELNLKLNSLMDELTKIQEERKRREIEIKPINNPVLKAHLTSKLNNLIEEENKKQSEIEEIRKLIQ